MTPKPFETLAFLVRNHGRTVGKGELLDAVWKDSFVTEDTLVKSVREIRRVLEDDKESPRFIQTVPGEGYRFIAEVVEKTPQAVSEARENDATPDLSKKEGGGAGSAAKRAQRSSRWIGLATLLVLAIGSVWFYLARLARRSSQLPPMKVVRLTSFPGKEIEPALSHDGKMVAILFGTVRRVTIVMSTSC